MNLYALTLLLGLNVIASANSDFREAYEKKNPISRVSDEEAINNHQTGSDEVANAQDELSADVQELIQEETNEKVIEFLAEAEELMVQTTDNLYNHNTSNFTIAIPTEIIEKIAQAAQQKSKSSPSKGKGDGALMEMMNQMMQQSQGNAPQPGEKPGEGSGSKPGEGGEGGSQLANGASDGDSTDSDQSRRLSKSSGSAGTTLPREFHKALDAFNNAQNTSH